MNEDVVLLYSDVPGCKKKLTWLTGASVLKLAEDEIGIGSVDMGCEVVTERRTGISDGFWRTGVRSSAFDLRNLG